MLVSNCIEPNEINCKELQFYFLFDVQSAIVFLNLTDFVDSFYYNCFFMLACSDDCIVLLIIYFHLLLLYHVVSFI